MSQTTTTGAAAAKATEKKTVLSRVFTDLTQNPQLAGAIDPQFLLLQLSAAGIQYQPATMQGYQARVMLNWDIKTFVEGHFAAQGVNLEEDEATAKQVSTWFESALLKSNYWLAIQSGYIAQERVQELMNAGGFGFGMGFGMGMNPMMGGFGGGMQQMGGFGGFNPMMGGMGMGMPFQAQQKKDANAKPGQQQTNPMMGGFGFNPMMGGMGMGMKPMMGGMGMGMNPMMGGFGFPMA